MGQSLVKNYIHIVFSTKNREPIIDEEIQEELFSYLAGIFKNMECNPVKIGGYKDHVHILCLLSKKVTLIKLLESLKSHSSKWIKTKDKKYSHFYWQNGYGSFSVNPKEIDTVTEYISNQKEHHTIKNFKEEFLIFLRNYEMEFDERYVWD
ncbi:IS200/IS605 family transposase [Chryseobacterium sp. RRHN12]|uniref:IS200/IS605 family transposase n=1 Tax=Chryseobacterium sp. RRHN12 TaxID=3437884 RepID=UPI003D9B6BFD